MATLERRAAPLAARFHKTGKDVLLLTPEMLGQDVHRLR
jgi:hypothetical protein